MGYAGKLELKRKAQELRRKGLSYNAILLQVNVSKDTLSRWCKDISLTPEQNQQLLQNKALGQRKGSIIAAENKRNLRVENTKDIFSLAKKDLGFVTKRDKFIFGLALYAGEGSKTDGKAAFVNANPFYIRFMSGWFQEFCEIDIEDMRGSIWLHSGNNEKEAKEYWSQISGLPKEQFHKTYIAVNKLTSNKIRKNIHNYGVFSLKFYRSNSQRKIMGWISAFLGDKIANTQEIEFVPR